MNTTNLTKGGGIVTARQGADGDEHESIFYDVLITEPKTMAGKVPHIQPERRFDPGMKIHPANVKDWVDVVVIDGQAKYYVLEGVAFAPCAAGQVASGGGVFDRLIRVLRVQLGGATAAPSGSSSGGVGE